MVQLVVLDRVRVRRDQGLVQPGEAAPVWARPGGWACACCREAVEPSDYCRPCSALGMQQCNAPLRRGGQCSRWVRGGRCGHHKGA